MEPSLEHLPPDQPAAHQLQRMLGVSGAREIRREPSGGLGHCYWNVLARTERKKGSLVYGWLLEWIPGVIAIATHHGVWRSPSGKLIDVTPASTSTGPGRSTFVVDANTPVGDLSWPVLIECRFVPMVKDPLLDDWYRCYRSTWTRQKKMNAILRNLGWAWTPNQGWAPPEAGTPPYPDEFLKARAEAAEILRYWASVRATVAAKYSSPSPGRRPG
jgi:hypothetical protein